VNIQLPATCQLTADAELAWSQGALLHQLQAATDGKNWWPVALQRPSATESTALSFDGATETWEQVGQDVVTTEQVAALADRLLDEPFLTAALLEDMTSAQWQQQVLTLLTDHYQLTRQKDGPDNAD